MAITDRWIMGEGLDTGAEYLVRTAPPRCIVQLEAEEALLMPLVVFSDHGEGFGVAAWLDPEPDEATHRAILAEAMAACELFTREAFDDDA